MPVAGGVALGSLPQAGRGERRRSCNDGADRPAVSGAAVLRLAPDGGVVGDAGPCRQSQTGPTPDAAAGTGGDLPTPEHEQSGSGPQDLPVPPRWDRDRAGQSGMVLGRYLHPDGQGLPLPGGHHGLGETSGAGVAVVQPARRCFLCRCTRGSARSLRPPRDLQYRPEPAPAKAGGSQFTSDDFTGTLKRHAITISMDGKGRYMDNIFVERLWRSLKYEEVYLNAYASVAEAKAGIGSWLGFYNEERQHQSLGYRTPRQAYEAECRWTCGRSASPTGCAFAPIPTGTTANHRIDVDEGEGRSHVVTVAPAAIGAGTQIGRATP